MERKASRRESERLDRSQTKLCAVCGRTITWRKKWERNWDQIRYCSKRCRGNRAPDAEAALEQRILDMLAARARDATMCPSEVARAAGEVAWREQMEPVRAAARRLVARGKLEVLQGGHPVDPATARGPIRLRLRRQ